MNNSIKKILSICSLAFMFSNFIVSANGNKPYSLLREAVEVSENSDDLKNNIKIALDKLFKLKMNKYISSLDLNEKDLQKLKDVVLECLNFYEKNAELRTHHFGYPANMCEKSILFDILKSIEKDGFLANNCGDVNEVGNYQMDSKKIERDILRLFAEKFGIEDNYWGYITSGGSESNQWGINEAFTENPDGILYFCESAHYSIYKYSEHYNRRIIPQTSDTDESIDCNALFKQIEKDYKETHSPANLVLTWGTTKYGSCDDIKRITDYLISKNIPYYVHVDAALFGGIPNNQLDAPIISNIKELNINSISTSLHKYIGVPNVKSVLLSRKCASGKHIDYIGQTDSTTSGSRDIMPFSTRQQVVDILQNSDPEDYRKNIDFFAECLREQNVEFIRNGNSNIFVVDAPSDEICKKYQLSCFKDKLGKQKAHIIIFPYQDQEIIKELANNLHKTIQGE